MKFNLLDWSYDGQKLASPHVVLWKLLWFIPLKMALALAFVFTALGFGLDAAVELWESI